MDNSDSSEQKKIDNLKKIFVGNVPFQCSKEEFQECFKGMDGYVTADIKRRHNSELSRGFGFVVFDSEEKANKLLEINNIVFKDRNLRFSPYTLNSYANTNTNTNTYTNTYTNANANDNDNSHANTESYHDLCKIFAYNLDGLSVDDIKIGFSDFGEVKKCVLNNKNGKTYGIITFSSPDECKNALESEITLDGKKLFVKSFKNYKSKKNGRFFSNPVVAYREGFKSGKIVGFHEGFLEGLKRVEN